MSSLYKDGPVLRYRHFPVECRGKIAGRNMNSHIEFAGSLPSKYTVRWGNVGIIASHRGPYVAVLSNEVVRGIKPHPAEVRHQNVNPGMSRVWGGSVVVLMAAVKISGYIARRNADMAEKRDHRVGEILTNPPTARNGFVYG